jgi:DNA-directed RNA polymerase specialized sigma24 family protein
MTPVLITVLVLSGLSRLNEDHLAGAASRLAAYDLARALDELPPDRREAVVLHHVWGFRFDEIASRLGIREGAARLRAHRGIKALRQFFTRGQP